MGKPNTNTNTDPNVDEVIDDQTAGPKDPGEETPAPDPDSQDDSDDDNNDGVAWEDVFPDKTPEEVKAELKTWVKHSRDWEKRAKDRKKQLETDTSRGPDEALTEKFNDVQAENLMFRDLIALEVEHNHSVPISELADSIAFRDAYKALDRDADDFADKLQSIVDKRTQKHSPKAYQHLEVTPPNSTGADLYDRIFNSK